MNWNTDITVESALHSFVAEYQLPESYYDMALEWFVPLSDKINSQHRESKRTLLIGLNGCQGSGKTTLASLMVFLFKYVFKKQAVAISLDDFYLTRNERLDLARNIHPLLKTRGVPGTHDIDLAMKTLQGLVATHGLTAIPQFNKAIDDRAPLANWLRIEAPVDIVILEGWCLGTPVQSGIALETPINELEYTKDRDGSWRKYVNQKIESDYTPLYALIDSWIMLKAPSFDSVFQWRLEQEDKLIRGLGNSSKENQTMNSLEIGFFIQHFQRLTEHSLLCLPETVNHLFKLDSDRDIIRYSQRK